MIKITHIRSALRLFAFDPKENCTEWHIQARDMTHEGHIYRAKQLISFYIEGARDSTALVEAGWHLACGVAKGEGIYSEGQQTTRRKVTKRYNEDAPSSGVERN